MKKSSIPMSGHRFAFSLVIIASLLFSACKKEHESNNPEQDAIEKSSNGLSPETIDQLRAARNATEKYQDLNKAIADGYADINVVQQNMGFHYLKTAILDTIFDPEKPELLVYNKQHDGSIKLVAVEYAVPIPLMPAKAPGGFAGPFDNWTYSTTFNLWLLHAWVWEFNPQGIFTPSNPLVHLH